MFVFFNIFKAKWHKPEFVLVSVSVLGQKTVALPAAPLPLWMFFSRLLGGWVSASASCFPSCSCWMTRRSHRLLLLTSLTLRCLWPQNGLFSRVKLMNTDTQTDIRDDIIWQTLKMLGGVIISWTDTKPSSFCLMKANPHQYVWIGASYISTFIPWDECVTSKH